MARADVFCTTDGSLQVAELNSDTPSGVDEAYLLGNYAEKNRPGEEFFNANKHLPKMLRTVIYHAFERLTVLSEIPTVGIVYPTDLPEDMGMINLYQEWLSREGYNVVLGSPWNLSRSGNGRVALFGTEIDVLLRHFKTDWFCERTPVWKDAPPAPDSGPMMSVLQTIIEPM